MAGQIVAVCVSAQKGERKTPVSRVELQPEHGIVGDAHAGPGHRQVSLLDMESIRKMQRMGLHVVPGDFAENITTEGVDLLSLSVGMQLIAGGTVLEITQIGKECHARCNIFYQAGDCVMPKEGVFARVLVGGMLEAGDKVSIRSELMGKATA